MRLFLAAEGRALFRLPFASFVSQLLLYTDGSSRGNPGPGGYGAILIWGSVRKELSGAFRTTTNNRMELLAVITGLEALTREGVAVTVYSDSKYVVDSVTKGWVFGWVKKGFAGKKNADLWQRYLRVHQKHRVQFVWVKGHADNPLNNRCDQLATEAADRGPWEVDAGFERSTHLD
jgi:ribonuclease HI